MPAYCPFQNLEITDATRMEEYVERVKPVTKRYGRRYVVIGGKVDLKEGDWVSHWPVIIEFPRLQAAYDWYDSEDYRPLKSLRQSAGRFSAVFIEDLSV